MKAHSADKLYYWARYCDSFATVTSKTFAGRRACIDLYASSGINELQRTGELSWGSALISLQVGHPFDVYVFGDIDPRATATLAERVADLRLSGNEIVSINLGDEHLMTKVRNAKGLRSPIKTVIFTGDANDAPIPLRLLLPAFERRRVSLTMLDPYSASFHWTSLANLTLNESMDIMLLFAEDMDLERNLHLETRLDAFMGTREWRQAILALPTNRGRALRELYEERLSSILGYQLGEPKTIRNSRQTPIYKLLFMSKAPLGLKLWNDGNRRTPAGQDAFYLGPEFL